ncbi:GGDEF domain-containing protein [Eisenbergiella sp.]
MLISISKEVLVLILALILASLMAAATILVLCKRLKQVRSQFNELEKRNKVELASVALAGIYDNILEADVTHDRLLGDNCARLTALLELPENATYTVCIEKIMEKMVKMEYHQLYREKFGRENILRRFSEGEEKFSLEVEERSDLVRYRWIRATVRIYYSRTEDSIHIISFVQNIQEEKEHELLLKQEALTDYLTGLLNRRGVEDRIREMLGKDQEDICHALLVMDIDHFKQINDAIGHKGGDAVLRKIAELLQAQFQESDVVGRFGGDEFLIFMTNCGSEQNVFDKAHRLTEAVAAWKEYGISLSLSIGIAFFPQHGDDFEKLFVRADAALYYVKTHGRNGFLLYNADKLPKDE